MLGKVELAYDFLAFSPANAEKRAQFGQYLGAVHMHAFQDSLIYAFVTKFDQHISDMTAVIVLKHK